MKSRIREAAALIRRLYTLPRCAAGGPLHAELDDGNLGLEFTMEPMYEIPRRGAIPARPDRWPAEVHDVCDRIYAVMGPMTEYHRRVARRLGLPA